MCCLRGPTAMSTCQPARTWMLPLVLLCCWTTASSSSLLHSQGEPELTASACFNNPQKFLQLNCSAGEMLRIKNVFYGHSASGTCGHTEGDCVLANKESHPCVGRSICKINLPTGDHGRKIPSCQKYSTYLQVHFYCVPAEDSLDICEETSVITQQRGYIHTSRYPNNYPPSKKCKVSIEVHKSQTILLYVVDFNLQQPDNINGCLDRLYLHDSFRSKTVCGRRSQGRLFSAVGNKLSLTFQSDSGKQQKGFWLYYAARPWMNITITSVSTSLTSTQSPQKPSTSPAKVNLPSEKSVTANGAVVTGRLLTSTYHKHLITQQPNHHTRVQDVPIEAIIGGVLGSLLLVLIVLLVLLILKRRKEKKLQESTSSQQLDVHTTDTIGIAHIYNNLHDASVVQIYC